MLFLELLLFSSHVSILLIHHRQLLHCQLVESVDVFQPSAFLPHALHQRGQISILLLQPIGLFSLLIQLLFLVLHRLLHLVQRPLQRQHLFRPLTVLAILALHMLLISTVLILFPP